MAKNRQVCTSVFIAVIAYSMLLVTDLQRAYVKKRISEHAYPRADPELSQKT